MIFSFFTMIFLCLGVLFAQQKKINLDDVKIEGEGLRGAKISLSNSDRTDLEKHLTIRKDFRQDIVNVLPSELKNEDAEEKKVENKK